MVRIRAISPIAIVLLAFALRAAPLGANRFMEDEALYGAWGLQIATGADPMLDYEPVDKPPLLPYTLALSFKLFGLPAAAPATQGAGGDVAATAAQAAWLRGAHQAETAARLPGLMASVLGVALVYALGRRLGFRRLDDRVGGLAALLVAVSPLDIAFAPTAFTDPLMVALVLGAFLAAVAGRPAAAGLLAGLAWAAKQQAVLLLPLVVAAVLVAGLKAAMPGADSPGAWPVLLRRAWSRPWVRLVVPLALVVGGVFWWDAARVQRPGFLAQSLISYGGLTAAQPGTLGERAAGWLRLAGEMWAWPWANALLVGAIGAWLIAPRRLGLPTLPTDRTSPGTGRRLDLTLAAFVAAFLGLHWLAGFHVWDRYLLGLVPVVAVLAARAMAGLGRALAPALRASIPAPAAGVVLGLGLIGVAALAWVGVAGAARLDADHRAYDGIDRLAATVRTDVPPGAVLYHHWLGYHYRFYLYGAPLRLHWYPEPADLVQDAIQYRREPRYVAFPSFRDGDPVRQALDRAGIRLVPVAETTRRDGTVSFQLYRMEGPDRDG